MALKAGAGYGIARLRSSSGEAVLLRHALYGITKETPPVTIEDSEYELRGHVFESFGEDVYRVELRRVWMGTGGKGDVTRVIRMCNAWGLSCQPGGD